MLSSIFSFSLSKYKIIAVVAIAAVIVSGYFMIKSLRSELDAANLRVQAMENTVREQRAIITQLNNDIARIGQIQANLFAQLNNAQASTRDLERRFTQDNAGRARNFAATANRAPARVEERVNIGTRDALRCNEIATGAALTEEEKAGTVNNTICPELIRSRARR